MNTSKYLRVATPIQAALFNTCVRPEITGKNGRWAGKTIARTMNPWKDVEAIVDADNVGREFNAERTRINVNDSNWVNQDRILKKLMRVAKTANGGIAIEKKQLVDELVALKATFSKVAGTVAEAA